MPTSRRGAMGALATFALAPALSQAQSYPTRPVRVVVPFAPGALTDTLGRIVAKHFQAALGQPFLVDNVAGGNSVVGTERIVKSAPDGYALLVSATHVVAVPAVTPNMPYDTRRDLTPIAMLASTPLVLLVNPSVPANTPAEFVAYAKAQPKGLSYGSSGVGSSIHFAGSMLASATGAPLVHIPYQGSAKSITDVIGGSIPSIFLDVGSAQPLVGTGKVRAIGVTSLERSPLLPNVAPLSSVVPGFNIAAWYGLYGPAGLPKPIVLQLNRLAVEAVNSPENTDIMIKRGNVPGNLDADQFARFVSDELLKWARIAKEANIKAE